MIQKQTLKNMTDRERLQASNLGLPGLIVHGRDGQEIAIVMHGRHDHVSSFAERMNRKYIRGIDRDDRFYDLEKIHQNNGHPPL